MEGLMMNTPLTLTPLLERAGRLFPKKEIASRTEAGMHRYTLADFHARVHRLAWVLEKIGVQRGERVGTLCWNGHRHLELYFGVTCFGAVLHTLNLRLAADQLAYIINHGEDRVIFVDASLVPLLDQIRGEITGVRRIIVLDDDKANTSSCWRARRRSRMRGRNWRRPTLARLVIRREPPGIPRACCTRIDRWCCTAWRWRWRIHSR